MKRGVLGVDGHDLRAGRFGERHHQLASNHERLLVGKRQVDALAERGHGRAQAGGAHERVEHQVGARLHDEAHQPFRAAQNLPLGPRIRGKSRRVLVDERDPPHAVRARLLHERLPRALGREADQLELVAALQHVERLGADRAGGAKDERRLGIVTSVAICVPGGSWTEWSKDEGHPPRAIARERPRTPLREASTTLQVRHTPTKCNSRQPP